MSFGSSLGSPSPSLPEFSASVPVPVPAPAGVAERLVAALSPKTDDVFEPPIAGAGAERPGVVFGPPKVKPVVFVAGDANTDALGPDAAGLAGVVLLVSLDPFEAPKSPVVEVDAPPKLNLGADDVDAPGLSQVEVAVKPPNAALAGDPLGVEEPLSVGCARPPNLIGVLSTPFQVLSAAGEALLPNELLEPSPNLNDVDEAAGLSPLDGFSTRSNKLPPVDAAGFAGVVVSSASASSSDSSSSSSLLSCSLCFPERWPNMFDELVLVVVVAGADTALFAPPKENTGLAAVVMGLKTSLDALLASSSSFLRLAACSSASFLSHSSSSSSESISSALRFSRSFFSSSAALEPKEDKKFVVLGAPEPNLGSWKAGVAGADFGPLFAAFI